MTVFLNILNKAEIAKASSAEVQRVLAVMLSSPPEMRPLLMQQCMERWTESFPSVQATAALEIFEDALQRQRERSIEAAGLDMLARQRLLADFLNVAANARRGLGSTAGDRRIGTKIRRAVPRGRPPTR